MEKILFISSHVSGPLGQWAVERGRGPWKQLWHGTCPVGGRGLGQQEESRPTVEVLSASQPCWGLVPTKGLCLLSTRNPCLGVWNSRGPKMPEFLNSQLPPLSPHLSSALQTPAPFRGPEWPLDHPPGSSTCALEAVAPMWTGELVSSAAEGALHLLPLAGVEGWSRWGWC